MQLTRHLAKPLAGLVVRSAQGILVLTLGVSLNAPAGPPRDALAAYDGGQITSSLWRRGGR